MNPRFFSIFRRLRHTFGYGVHSPLAFRLIKECVYPDKRYAYYVDSRIDFVCRTDTLRAQQVRMLVRLIDNLHPRFVWMPRSDGNMRRLIADAFPSLPVSSQSKCPGNADFIVISDYSDPVSLWSEIKPLNAQMVCLNGFKKLGDSFSQASAPTLSISARSFSIWIRRQGMLPVAYQIF